MNPTFELMYEVYQGLELVVHYRWQITFHVFGFVDELALGLKLLVPLPRTVCRGLLLLT